MYTERKLYFKMLGSSNNRLQILKASRFNFLRAFDHLNLEGVNY